MPGRTSVLNIIDYILASLEFIDTLRQLRNLAFSNCCF